MTTTMNNAHRAPRLAAAVAAALAVLTLAGCASPAKPYDFSAFRAARPATLLVMPPVNISPDVKATPATWAHATQPLSEAGYYVLPVTLVDETFRQNGIQTADDAQALPHAKLREVFGADAAVYIQVTRYGTVYQVIATETRVELQARIVDLRSGALLWEGKAAASSAEQQQNQGQGLLGVLLTAAINQAIRTATDEAFNYAGIASSRLLAGGVIPGPRARRKSE